MTDETFPLFDAHMHFSHAYLDHVLASYELYGVAGGINLWLPGFHGSSDFASPFEEFLSALTERGVRQFVSFYWPNWKAFGWQGEAFVEETCRAMRRYAGLGCRGLKVWKDLGMFIFHADGKPATMDDPALEPIWRTAGELDWTISIHQADPSPSFPKLARTGLSREDIYRRRDRVLAAHPEIRFILCHNANDIESVAKWAALLDRFPHCLADMGRDPERYDDRAAVREFLEAYADRIMLGCDLTMPDGRPPDDPWTLEHVYRPWRRRLLGFGLSDDALGKIAWGNGHRLFLSGG